MSRRKQEEQRHDTLPVTLLLRRVERPTAAARRVSFSSCWRHSLLSHWSWQHELARLGRQVMERKKKPAL